MPVKWERSRTFQGPEQNLGKKRAHMTGACALLKEIGPCPCQAYWPVPIASGTSCQSPHPAGGDRDTRALLHWEDAKRDSDLIFTLLMVTNLKLQPAQHSISALRRYRYKTSIVYS